MKDDTGLTDSGDMVAVIENENDPTQRIIIQYLREENAFVTSGIKVHFDEREILIPAYLVVMDLQLMGTIVSAILEKISQVHDREGTFHYVPQFDVFEKTYTLAPYGDYMKLSEAAE